MSTLEPAPAARWRERVRNAGTLAAGLAFGFLILIALVIGSSGLGPKGGPEPLARFAAATPEGATAARGDLSGSRRTAIVEAAQRVGPAVVTLSVVQTRVVQTAPYPFGSDFFEPFFRDMIPQYRYREEIPSMGSGFIISPKGYVLT